MTPQDYVSSQLVRFWDSLRKCKKSSVRYLFSLVYNDRRTLTGRTDSRIAFDCEVERTVLDWKQALNVRYFPPPPGELWRIPLLQELLEVRKGNVKIPGIDQEAIKDIIDKICNQ